MLRQLGLALALAGCHRFGGETWIFPLDELNAELRIGGDSRATAAYSSSMVQLYIVGNTGDYCRIVSPRETRATMNGSPGKVYPGEEYRGFYDDDNCIGPQFGWDSSPTGTVEFKISDDSASWSFVVENPFEALYPRVELLSHDAESNPVHTGDTVRLEVRTVHELLDMRVYMDEGGERLFEVDESSGLTVEGNRLSFVMPQVATQTGRLSVAGYLSVDFTRCDAPYGCKSEYAFNDNESIAIAP